MGIFQINHNISSMNVQRNLGITSLGLTKSLEKLSSGLRINTGSDGPADLTISELMRSDISATNAAIRNTQEAMGLFGAADGALAEVSNLLTDLKARVVHATNTGVVSGAQIAADQSEVNNALAAIARIFTSSTYSGKTIFGAAATFQVGPASGDTITGPATTKPLAVTTLSTTPTVTLPATLGLVSNAITAVTTLRGTIGSFMRGQLQTNINSLSVNVENLSSSESYIRDTNMAEETSTYTKQQILVQAGMSVLAQANVGPQSVLQLLK